MPVSKTSSGLILYDELDEQNGWAKAWVGSTSPPAGKDTDHIIDTTEKHSGSASFKDWMKDNYYPGYTIWGKNINMGTGAGRFLAIWHKLTKTTGGTHVIAYAFCVKTESIPFTHTDDCPATSEYATHNWSRHTITPTQEGTQYACIGVIGQDSSLTIDVDSWVDHLVISTGTNIVLTGLVAGQKVEVVRDSDDYVIDSDIVTGTTATLDVSGEDFPEQMYFKVYATDGTTLIETTSSYEMCGGDEWAWAAGSGTLTLASAQFIIIKNDSGASITATLKKANGDPYTGKAITFTTTAGSVSPTSDTTDANGEAHTTLTTTAHGVVVVTANWAGDATVPACSAWVTVHSFYAAEAPDSSEPYQIFVEGYPIKYSTGHYAFNEDGEMEGFEVEIPEWDSNITLHGVASIYADGVQEYSGLLKIPSRSLGVPTRFTIGGANMEFLLEDVVVDLKIYSAKTAQYILSDLLSSFPSGVTAGTLGSCSTTLTITLQDMTLREAIRRVVSAVGWKRRLTLERKLDFAASFSGGSTGITFAEGGDNPVMGGTSTEALTDLVNHLRVKGSGITSTRYDSSLYGSQGGIHRAVTFQKTISDQTTLDAISQASLDMRKAENLQPHILVGDALVFHQFGPEDLVTVTSATLGLSGEYAVKRIERDLTKPGTAWLDLDNRTQHFWELDAEYHRLARDASV